MWYLRDRKQIGWALLIFQAHCLGTVYRPLCREECRQSLENSVSWGDRAESIGKPRWLQFIGEWEPYKDKSSESCRGLPGVFSKGLISAWHAWGYYPEPGKESLIKWLKKQRLSFTQVQEYCLFQQPKLEIFMIHRALGRVLRESCLGNGK